MEKSKIKFPVLTLFMFTSVLVINCNSVIAAPTKEEKIMIDNGIRCSHALINVREELKAKVEKNKGVFQGLFFDKKWYDNYIKEIAGNLKILGENIKNVQSKSSKIHLAGLANKITGCQKYVCEARKHLKQACK